MRNNKFLHVSHAWALACCLVVGSTVIALQTNYARNPQNSNSSSSTKKSTGTTKSDKSATTSAQTGNIAGLSAKDKSFMMEAAMGGMAEVELGRLATQKGTSDAVKQFGQKMVDDHSAANTQLTQLASTKGINLPAELDAKHKADVTRLSKLSGAAFDRAYSKDMLDDHIKDVAAFEKQSTNGTDPDLKAFAAKTLPTLKTHLDLAKALNAKPTGTKPSSQ